MNKKYGDTVQMRLEAILLKEPELLKKSDELLAGFVMMGFNIFYEESLIRLAIARKNLHYQ